MLTSEINFINFTQKLNKKKIKKHYYNLIKENNTINK